MVTEQVPAPVQSAPDQPVKTELPLGAAVRTTVEPLPNEAEHVDPQSMPEGEDVTVPVPDPPAATVRV